MNIQCCFTNGATNGIGAEIATTPSGANSQVAARACKPEAVTKALRFSNWLLAVAPDVARQDKIETEAPLPIIAVVFTVGGPVVYQRPSK
jgi:NADP-dependent 3-hydroxy acid dehydrogenase YdfG